MTEQEIINMVDGVVESILQDETLVDEAIGQMLGGMEEEKVVLQNKTLCPKIWSEDKKLNTEIRDTLLKIALDFYKDTEIKAQVQDVYFLGSSANYNWTPKSDMDLHILIDISELSLPPDYAKKSLRAICTRWNMEHEVKIHGHPIEVYIQDVRENNRAGGVYSLVQDAWIKEPQPQDISVNEELIQHKYSLWVEKIKQAIYQEDVAKMKKLLEDLVDFREAGLSRGGEFSTENIVFKLLRSRKQIEKLKDTYNHLYDKYMSIPESTSMHTKRIKEGLEWETTSRYWMDSSGKLYPTKRHLIGARELLGEPPKKLSLGGEEDDVDYDRTASLLFEKGFLRISETENVIYATGPINTTQLKILKDRAIEKQKNVIYRGKEFDSKTGQTHVIYEKIKEGFDPTSMGPNPEATEGQQDPTFYQRQIDPMRQLEEGDQKPIDSKYFTAYLGDPRAPKSGGVIQIKGDPQEKDNFANFYQGAEDWGKLAGKWILNRHTGAFNMKLPDMSLGFNSIEEMLAALDKWYEETNQSGSIVKNEVVKDTHTDNDLYWKSVSDDERQDLAVDYFSVGQEDEENIARSFCWIWDKADQSIQCKQGGTHARNFGSCKKDYTFSGWYDPDKDAISIVFPEHEVRKLGGRRPTIDDVPPLIFNHLLRKFNTSHPKFKVFEETHQSHGTMEEGYGPGDPDRDKDRLTIKNDDKTVRRWQIKSKDAPKTPKMNEFIKDIVNEAMNSVFPLTEEKCDSKDLYIGYILPDLTVGALRSDRINKNPGQATHTYFVRKFGIVFDKDPPGALAWRYRKDLDTFWFWDRLPNEKEKFALDGWMEKQFGVVKNSTFRVLVGFGSDYPESRYNQAHGEKEEENVQYLMESPEIKTLKKNRKPLTDEERKEVMERGAVWHHGPNGEETPAVWKAVVKGKTWYVCNTHRAGQVKPTLKGAIQAFEFIKTTA